jgi:hypothetical protein
MNNDLERMCKEVVMAKFKYCPGICLEGLKKNNLSQDSWSLDLPNTVRRRTVNHLAMIFSKI